MPSAVNAILWLIVVCVAVVVLFRYLLPVVFG